MVNRMLGRPQGRIKACGQETDNTQLERVMNLAEKPHQDADSAVSSVHRQPPIFRIGKPFLSKFMPAPRIGLSMECPFYGLVFGVLPVPPKLISLYIPDLMESLDVELISGKPPFSQLALRRLGYLSRREARGFASPPRSGVALSELYMYNLTCTTSLYYGSPTK